MKIRIRAAVALVLVVVLIISGCSIKKPDELAHTGSMESSSESTLTAYDEVSQPVLEDGADDSHSSSDSVQSEGNTKPAESKSTSPAESKPVEGSVQDPASHPDPVDPVDSVAHPKGQQVNEKKQLKCTLSITCHEIFNHMDEFNKDKLSVLPKDGVIYSRKEVTFTEGESVFDVLAREMQKNRIHMEYEFTPIYNSNYIEGINNLYEKDLGSNSGWKYKVNGWFSNYGCSQYQVKEGDLIEWEYVYGFKSEGS